MFNAKLDAKISLPCHLILFKKRYTTCRETALSSCVQEYLQKSNELEWSRKLCLSHDLFPTKGDWLLQSVQTDGNLPCHPLFWCLALPSQQHLQNHSSNETHSNSCKMSSFELSKYLRKTKSRRQKISCTCVTINLYPFLEFRLHMQQKCHLHHHQNIYVCERCLFTQSWAYNIHINWYQQNVISHYADTTLNGGDKGIW